METGGWSLGADKAATQLIGRPSKYLTSVKNFNMNYPRKLGNTQPCGNYESAFWPILKVHNFYMSVSLKIQTSPDWRRWNMATAQIPTIVSSWVFYDTVFFRTVGRILWNRVTRALLTE